MAVDVDQPRGDQAPGRVDLPPGVGQAGRGETHAITPSATATSR